MDNRVTELIYKIENNLINQINNLEENIQESVQLRAKNSLRNFEKIAFQIHEFTKMPFFSIKRNMKIYQKTSHIHADNLDQLIKENEKSYKILKKFLQIFKKSKFALNNISQIDDDIYQENMEKLKMEQELIFCLKDALRGSKDNFQNGNLDFHFNSKKSLISSIALPGEKLVSGRTKFRDTRNEYLELKQQYNNLLEEHNQVKSSFHSSVSNKVVNIGLKQENEELKDQLLESKSKIESLREKLEKIENEKKELSEDFTRKRLGKMESELEERDGDIKKLKEIVKEMNQGLENKERKMLKLQKKLGKREAEYRELKDHAEEALTKLKEDYNEQVENYVALENKVSSLEEVNQILEEKLCYFDDENRALRIKVKNFDSENSVMELIKMSRNLNI